MPKRREMFAASKYRGLVRARGLEPSDRRAQRWRDIELRVHDLVDARQVTPLWIIGEAQNLPAAFFRARVARSQQGD